MGKIACCGFDHLLWLLADSKCVSAADVLMYALIGILRHARAWCKCMLQAIKCE